LRAVVFFAAVFFAGVRLRAVVFFAAVFFAGVRLRAVVFFAVVFFAAVFLAVDRLTGDLFAGAVMPLPPRRKSTE
jgi:hypothetical protein